eukprot:TRINITY_DN45888_c0_g1_i2.p2 TRINITY_DN45888_c0_g1~~TRINITY_DN45888_c0_g1_i2.p2  ORF type:complete len:173 (+),score=40.82 TRINITY_DN45888_c0_g1_i2:94-612(+)
MLRSLVGSEMCIRDRETVEDTMSTLQMLTSAVMLLGILVTGCSGSSVKFYSEDAVDLTKLARQMLAHLPAGGSQGKIFHDDPTSQLVAEAFNTTKPCHYHEVSAQYTLITGRYFFQIAGGNYTELGPGDSFITPAHHVHWEGSVGAPAVGVVMWFPHPPTNNTIFVNPQECE